MKTVLVTGGAGYIGSHCCKALHAAGFLPVSFDNLSTGHRDFVRWGPIVEGDIRDEAALSAVLAEHAPVAVLHFAAVALVGESVREPRKYWDINVCGTLRLLSAMADAGVSRLVASSTCAVYGEPATPLIDEDTPRNPVNPYGASKLAAERLMDDFDAAHGVKSVRLRYFNAAGADPDGEIGEHHEVETHLIPLVLDAAMGRRPHIGVFGTDFATPDGTAVRDYVHVQDLAAAHVAALRYLLEDGATASVNLGTGKGASVREVIRAAEAVVGHAIPSQDVVRRAGDPAHLVADPSRGKALLGWTAQRSDLAVILAHAWAWHLDRFGRQRAAASAE